MQFDVRSQRGWKNAHGNQSHCGSTGAGMISFLTLAAELACWSFLFGGAYIAWGITP